MKKDNNIKLFVTFLIVSLGAGIIEFLSFTLISLINSENYTIRIAEIVSVILSCTFNFTVNRKVTFKSSNNIVLGMIFYGLFYLITTPIWAEVMIFFNDYLGDGYLSIIKISKMILNFILDFLFCKFVLFGILNKYSKMNVS